MEPTPDITPELLLSHAPSLRTLARRLLREADAEDLLQETWLEALKRPPRRSDGLGAWLRAVLRNRVRMWQRGEAHRGERDRIAARPEALESTVTLVERRAAMARLVAALEELPEPYADAIWLRFFEDLPAPEIARRGRIAEVTVRTRIHRGLRLLRERLERESGGEPGAWLPALAAAAGSPGEAAGGALGTGAGVAKGIAGKGVLIMSTNAKIAALAACVVALLLVLWRGVGPLSIPVQPVEPGAKIESPAPGRIAIELAEAPVVADAKPTEEPVEAQDALSSPPPAEEEPAAQPATAPAILGPMHLRRSFTAVSTFDLADMVFELNGVEQALPTEGNEPALELKHEIVVRDGIIARGFGLAPRIARLYDRILMSYHGPGIAGSSAVPEEEDAEGRSSKNPLEGVPLLFDYDPVDKAWRASIARSEIRGDAELPDPELLEGLTVDLDLRDLAPPQGLAPGMGYTVPARKLESLFRPGGELGLSLSGEGEDAFLSLVPTLFMADPEAFEKAEGQLRLELAGLQESNPNRLVLALELDIEATWNRVLSLEVSPELAELQLEWEPSISWSATGELIWDGAEGRARSLELEGEVEIELVIVPSTPGRSEEYRIEAELSGTSSIALQVEDR